MLGVCEVGVEGKALEKLCAYPSLHTCLSVGVVDGRSLFQISDFVAEVISLTVFLIYTVAEHLIESGEAPDRTEGV